MLQKRFCVFIVLCFCCCYKHAIQNMLQCTLSNCVEQVRDTVSLFAHNNLILADKLVDISYRERSLKWAEIVNSDLHVFRIAVDSQLIAYVFTRFVC